MRTLPLTFVLASSCVIAACGNDAPGDESTNPYSLGSGGATAGAGGAQTGGAGVASGGAVASSGGAPDVPAGQLFCSGRQCPAGGHCTETGLCPGFFGDCFTHAAGMDTCAVYCQSKGLTCAAASCNSDGTAFEPPHGYTWASYPAARSAECGTSAFPAQFAKDDCTTPIWLSPSKPLDDVVRCCCR